MENTMNPEHTVLCQHVECAFRGQLHTVFKYGEGLAIEHSAGRGWGSTVWPQIVAAPVGQAVR